MQRISDRVFCIIIAGGSDAKGHAYRGLVHPDPCAFAGSPAGVVPQPWGRWGGAGTATATAPRWGARERPLPDETRMYRLERCEPL